jgi:predicted phage baseplate assembly protein
VNDVQWHEAETLADLKPNGRKFLTSTDDDSKASVVFGDGNYGVRLPTGIENVKAAYRNGIGKPGNVKAGQITLLGTRPLGVKEVTNPIRASGGADRESRDQARQNAPLALHALDRLVSVADYKFFSCTFAGIGKAAARREPDGHQQIMRIIIAGADDIPIEPTSDVYRNLLAALHRFGDPFLSILLVVRERLALVISANVKIEADYLWEKLEPKIRAALVNRFSFEKAELGEGALLSAAIDAIQAVRGVVYVDIDVFTCVSEAQLLKGFTQRDAVNLERLDRVRINEAQVAYLVPDVADTLILQEIKS